MPYTTETLSLQDLPDYVLEVAAPVCLSGDNHILYPLQIALDNLKAMDFPFAFFNIELSHHDYGNLNKLTIKGFHHSLLFAHLESLEHEIKIFLKDLLPNHNNENQVIIKDIAKLLISIVTNILKSTGYKDAKITLLGYDEQHNTAPYWHIDKSPFEILELCPMHEGKDDYIFIVPLVGESTLFYKDTKKDRQKFLQYAQHDYVTLGYFEHFQTMPKSTYNDLFAETNISSPKSGQGSVHLAGMKYGAIHATPSTEQGRLLMIVQPGKSWAIKAMGK